MIYGQLFFEEWEFHDVGFRIFYMINLYRVFTFKGQFNGDIAFR